jgi:hypothetical protein
MQSENNKLFLNYVEFYITNVCNFNCTGCNRFNNYNFSGTQRWEDYKNIYARWSKVLSLPEFSILGGEPMLNPTYKDWILGLTALWPRAKKRFITNASQLRADDKELYNIFSFSSQPWVIEIGLHNVNRKQEMVELIKSWLGDNIVASPKMPDSFYSKCIIDPQYWKKNYNAIKGNDWPDCDTPEEWYFLPEHIKKESVDIFNFSPDIVIDYVRPTILQDKNGLTIKIDMENFFHQGALIRNTSTNKINLHNSDPALAHAICHSKTCHHFDKGKLYKCGQVALISEFDQQFGLDLSYEDRQLMQSYDPGTLDQPYDQLEQFILNLPNQLNQCKFCPENYTMKELHAEVGNKIILKKRKKENK